MRVCLDILCVSANVQGAANSTSWDKSNLDLNFFIAIKTFWKSFYSLLSFQSTMALKDLWHQLSTSKIYGTEYFNPQKKLSSLYLFVVFLNIRITPYEIVSVTRKNTNLEYFEFVQLIIRWLNRIYFTPYINTVGVKVAEVVKCL